jgi:uncharacterized protein YbaR (Trm112 family)
MSLMRSTLVDILACPVCKSHPLDLTVEKKDDDDVVEGSLRCPQCKAEYPIVDGIPDMIPPKDR